MNRSRDRARLLLQKSQGDFLAMRQLMENKEIPAWTIGFHAQQAIEKAIKAVMIFHDVEFPFSHDLDRLIGILIEKELPIPPDAVNLKDYTTYGSSFRYEDEELGGLPVLDRAEALQLVTQTVAWAEEIIQEKRY